MRSAIVRAGVGAAAAGGLIAVGALAPAAATSVRPAVAKTAAGANTATFTIMAKGLTFATDATGEKSLPGNTFEVSEADMLRGHRVGTDYVACTAVTKVIAECNATWDFGKVGTLQIGGLDRENGAFTVAITGGTGRYAGAGGTVTISFPKGNGPAKQVFHVTGSRVTP